MIVDIRWYFLANVELATTSLSNNQTIIMINEKCKLGLVCPQFSVNLRYIWEWFWKNGKVGNAPILLPIGYSLCCMQLEEKTQKSPIFSKNDICRALGPFFSDSSCNFWSTTPLFWLKKIFLDFLSILSNFLTFFHFFYYNHLLIPIISISPQKDRHPYAQNRWFYFLDT